MSNQEEQKPGSNDKIIEITIRHDGYNLKMNFCCHKKKKLRHFIDKLCNRIKEINEDSFFTEFDYFIENGDNKKLDPNQSIEENNITDGSIILAKDKPKNPNTIRLKVIDCENRKIPREIELKHKIKKDFKHLCSSLNQEISNTLFLCKEQVIDINKKAEDLNYLQDNEVISIAQIKPIFNIWIENVPYDSQINELIEFLKEYQPLNCEIFASDQKGIPGYANISFRSQSNAMFAVAKCSKDEFKKHKMTASIQNF